MKLIKKIIESIEKTNNFRWAFTHSSYQNELGLEKSYEILEFLGDSILNFHTSLFIYNNYSHFTEGQMSKLKQFIVKESTLAEISKKIGLPAFLQLGSGERKNRGMEKESILADIFESFIAALYLEKGEKTVWKFLGIALFPWVKGKEELIWDYKSQLQEVCQAQHNSISYRVIGKKNKEEKEINFIVEVNDQLGKFRERGHGRTKKDAEQQAAKKALKKTNKETTK